MRIIKDGVLSEGLQIGTNLRFGRKTVTTAGVAERLVASSTGLTQGVIITALKTNTDNVFIGTSSVDKTSDKQVELEPGEGFPISLIDLTNIWVDVNVNGEGVQFGGS